MSFVRLKRLFLPVVAILLPADCLVCRAPLPAEHDGGVCLPCWQSFRRLDGPCCRRCGEPLFPFENPDPPKNYQCGACCRRRRFFGRCRSAGIYQGALRESIHRMKFGGERTLGKSLGRWLARSLRGELAESDLVAPVPLHPSRRRERGFNQSELLSAEVAKVALLPHRPRLLSKATPTHPQTGLSRRERRRNLRGTFKVREPGEIKGKIILLVDDIYTTGGTVEECARSLRQKGARDVRVVTLARTVR